MNLEFEASYRRAATQLGQRDRYLRAGRWAAAALFDHELSKEFCLREKLTAKAQNSSTNTAGGVLVPDEVENSISTYRDLAGVFRREANVRQITSDSRSFPRRVGGLSASFTDEGQAATESENAFDSVTVAPKKLVGLARSSSELIEDDITDLGAWLIEEFGATLASVEDGCGWNGDGTATYGKMTGITTHLADGAHAGGQLAASGHDTYPELDAADLGLLAGLLAEQYLANAKWYCSAHALGNTFVRLGASAFGMMDTPSGPRPMLHYAGYPIVPTPKLPGAGDQSGKVMIAFGDLKAASIFGSRRGLTIKSSAGRWIERDQIAFKAIERFEIVAHNIGTASKPGAVVGLLGN